MECEETEEGATLISKINHKRFPAGKFSLRSVGSYGNLEPRNGGHLHIIHGHGMKSSKLYMVDVLTAQNHPDFNGATFQAASNFNCLEFIGSKQTAAKGVNVYVKDHTQGPSCAVAAGPAVTYRNYFVLHEDGTRGQLRKEVELLSKTPLKIEHGYVKINQKECQRLQSIDFDWADLNNYQVGVHQNCKITIERSQRGMSLSTNDQITHQIYCAAFSFPRSVIVNNFTQNLAENILKAEYRATILAAWDNSIKYPDYKGSKKCFLTLLGGGVFHNPFEIICKAISSCKDVIEMSGLDVYVVCFDDSAFNRAYPLLKDTVTQTGGSIIEA
ncbi:hypothetical protein TRFO_32599 [Tritrichomonas foetus]|uniref:Uncharacterized protein n=1 Tax=Tritrichomonas foetus TaxID=1144522 RepID=A0A1J4JPL4_9EUKA|nr:hypothetical protein TRFO_32599 [Tritrichomonas foetus]|eukprot:OHT00682.1 hypothetical protein TRFO_32599 [Tritrichomonas foetus]